MITTNTKMFNGNIFWIFEALKIVNKEFDFDKPYEDRSEFYMNDILLYECIILNDDKEDSVFVQQNGVLYEFFSNDKCELVLKLIKYFENKHCKENKRILDFISRKSSYCLLCIWNFHKKSKRI